MIKRENGKIRNKRKQNEINYRWLWTGKITVCTEDISDRKLVCGRGLPAGCGRAGDYQPFSSVGQRDAKGKREAGRKTGRISSDA